MSAPTDLPPAPWSAARPRAKRTKPPLGAEAIVDAALALLDAEGLEAVTMRRVAERLGTGPASLYQHVSGKDELLELLFDRVVAEVELPAPEARDWQPPLKALLRSMRAVFSSHNDVAYAVLGRIPTGPNALTLLERLLAIMRAGGVPTATAAHAADALVLFIAAFSYEESIRATQFGGAGSEYYTRVHAYFSSLPADRFPTLATMADHLTSPDERFEFALEMHVQGIAALAAAADER